MDCCELVSLDQLLNTSLVILGWSPVAAAMVHITKLYGAYPANVIVRLDESLASFKKIGVDFFDNNAKEENMAMESASK